MAIAFTVTTSTKTTANGTVKLTVDVVGTNITSKVFAIEVYPVSADADNPDYRFSHVCSPMELSEFPEDTPGGNCYFRVSNIEMIFDTAAMAERVLSNITKDIRYLKNELTKLEAAEADTSTVVI